MRSVHPCEATKLRTAMTHLAPRAYIRTTMDRKVSNLHPSLSLSLSLSNDDDDDDDDDDGGGDDDDAFVAAAVVVRSSNLILNTFETYT